MAIELFWAILHRAKFPRPASGWPLKSARVLRWVAGDYTQTNYEGKPQGHSHFMDVQFRFGERDSLLSP